MKTEENKEQKDYTPERSGMRADLFLLEALSTERPGLTRAQLKLWFNDGLISSHGKLIKSGEKTRTGQAITVRFPEPESVEELPKAKKMSVDIRYEDE